MEAWLEWAKGPFFYFAFAFLVLGLGRHIVLTIWEINRAIARAGDKNINYGVVVQATLSWLFPVEKARDHLGYSVTTILFHVSIILVPIFLAGHVALIYQGTGLWWPTLPYPVADTLTLVAIVTALVLFMFRFLNKEKRALSQFSDYALLLIIAAPFATGLMLRHPLLNPFSFNGIYFAHVMSANVLMILIPITKLSHMVLMPTSQLIAEIGWKFPARSGSRVAIALGKENEPI